MTAPAIAAGRFVTACGIGALLGLFYGFLRPLRPRLTHLCDFLFLAGAFYAWLYLGFGICQGDLRLGYFAGLALGGFLWESTAGKWLRPVFSRFWRLLSLPFEKIYDFFHKIFKKLFAFRKKWVTIERNDRCQTNRNLEVSPNGKKTCKAGIPQQPHHYDRRSGGRHFRHRGSGYAAGFPGRKQKSI